jgi:HPt (histidine-containing phosphotransfer) domain-containing protein
MMIQSGALDDLLEIKIGLNQSLLDELVDMFLDQTPERISLIHTGIKNSNRDAISRTTHALKASCSYLGLQKMVILCEELEKWSRLGPNAEAEEAFILLAVLDESFDEASDELKKFLVKSKRH